MLSPPPKLSNQFPIFGRITPGDPAEPRQPLRREIVQIIPLAVDAVYVAGANEIEIEPADAVAVVRQYHRSARGPELQANDAVIPYLPHCDWLTDCDADAYRGLCRRGIDPRTLPDLRVPRDGEIVRIGGERLGVAK